MRRVDRGGPRGHGERLRHRPLPRRRARVPAGRRSPARGLDADRRLLPPPRRGVAAGARRRGREDHGGAAVPRGRHHLRGQHGAAGRDPARQPAPGRPPPPLSRGCRVAGRRGKDHRCPEPWHPFQRGGGDAGRDGNRVAAGHRRGRGDARGARPHGGADAPVAQPRRHPEGHGVVSRQPGQALGGRRPPVRVPEVRRITTTTATGTCSPRWRAGSPPSISTTGGGRRSSTTCTRWERGARGCSRRPTSTPGSPTWIPPSSPP